MTKRNLFACFTLCIWLGASLAQPSTQSSAKSAAAQSRPRPNILFILPDQLRAQSLGCMGNAEVKTPHIDRLAAEGMLFKQTFANTPVCCPARANLLTGKYAHRNGMVANDLRLRESETTLAELLKQAGYRTGFIGKWHLDGGPREPGYVPPGERRQGFDYWAAMRPNWIEGTRMGSRQDIASYYAQITAVDDQVGRLLGTLKELNLDDDTIIVFTSDHGDMLGSQGLRLKRKPWEESIRVPGIVRYPRRVKAGQRTDALLTHMDFAPTLLSLCGLKPARQMQGADLSRLILGQAQQAPDSAYFQIFGPFAGDETAGGWRGVRTPRYMYARYRDKPWVLYDLTNDPFEQKNLANDPASARLRAEMERKLSAWMKRTGDSWRYDWTELIEDKGRLYKHETFYSVTDYLKWARQHPELAPEK